MTQQELLELLDRLIADWENEVVEFKRAHRQFSAEKTRESVSALNNEANLPGCRRHGSCSDSPTPGRS